MDRYTLLIRALFTHRSTHTCRLTLARRRATRSIRQTIFNRAGYILRKCHLASRNTVGSNRQSHRLMYHRCHTHTRHGALKEQTAMRALVRDVVELFILALINMHGSTEGTSYDLVHQLALSAATSLKGTITSFSLHTTLWKTHV